MFKYCCLQPASSLACLGRVSLAKELAFTGMSRKPKERNFPTKHDRFKNPNWREADQLTIYKHDREVELGSTEKQLQRPATRDPRPATRDFGVLGPAPKESATQLSSLTPNTNLLLFSGFRVLSRPGHAGCYKR